MRPTGIRGSSIPSRNVCCATVVQSAARNHGAPLFIDAVTDIADARDQACDHGLSLLRPNCPATSIGCCRWPSPLLAELLRVWRRSRNGHDGGCVRRGSALVNVCTRPHPSSRFPLMCERGPLASSRVQRQFACRGSLLILRRLFRPAPTGENVTSGDHSGASRVKITADPTS